MVLLLLLSLCDNLWLCAWMAATSCISIDCPFFFERCRALRTTQHMFTVLRQTGMLHREPVASAVPQPSDVVVVDDDVIDLQDDD